MVATKAGRQWQESSRCSFRCVSIASTVASTTTPSRSCTVSSSSPRSGSTARSRPKGSSTPTSGPTTSSSAAPDAPPLAVVDWQTLTIGASVSDVAYLLGAAIDPARRREVEQDQLATYRNLLAGYGVEYDAETCWNEYALASLHGIVVGITATIMATETERGNNLFALMLNRHARHAIDVDALDRLTALA